MYKYRNTTSAAFLFLESIATRKTNLNKRKSKTGAVVGKEERG